MFLQLKFQSFHIYNVLLHKATRAVNFQYVICPNIIDTISNMLFNKTTSFKKVGNIRRFYVNFLLIRT